MKKCFLMIALLAITISMTACASDEESEELVATFDGNECKWEGPTELPVGEHSILYINTADYFAEFAVRKIIGEGITYQDFLDLQSTPGVSYDPPDGWRAPMRIVQLEWDAARDAYIYTYSFDNSGEYFARVWTTLSSEEQGLWFCSPLTIVESPNE